MSKAYEAAGVNLNLGDELSKSLHRASQETWPNQAGLFGEPSAPIDSFSSLRSLPLAPLLKYNRPEDLSFLMNDDGVGTKVEVAQRVNDLKTVAFDLFAMVADDAVIRGFKPVSISTTLDVRKLKETMRPRLLELALGYIAAAKEAGITIVNGEVAELGDLVGGYTPPGRILADKTLNFNWSATLLSVGNIRRLLDGRRVQEYDSLVAMREEGFRSNGISLVRKTAEENYGEFWHLADVKGTGKKLGRMVLHPAEIYTPVMVEAFGGFDPQTKPRAPFHGAAHITGGGIPEKVGRMLEPSGLGAELDDLYEPGEVVSLIQHDAELGDKEAYTVWNMGQGMIVATDKPKKLIKLAEEHGKEAKVVGEVTKDPKITIRSQGRRKGAKLVYRLN